MLQRFHDGLYIPDENAGVPEEIAALEEGAGELQRWLFCEGLDLVGLIYLLLHIVLYVAVTGIGTGGLDAEREEGLVMGHKVECLVGRALERVLIHNEVVSGRHDDIRLWVERHYLMSEVGSAGRSVLARWLANDILITDLRDLLLERSHVLLIGNKVYIFLGADVLEAVVGPLDEGAPGAQQVEELLGMVSAAFGPKPATYAAGHDGHVIILDAHFWRSLKYKVESIKLFPVVSS